MRSVLMLNLWKSQRISWVREVLIVMELLVYSIEKSTCISVFTPRHYLGHWIYVSISYINLLSMLFFGTVFIIGQLSLYCSFTV